MLFQKIWYFYDHVGKKQGPYTSFELKQLVETRVVIQSTIVECQIGDKVQRGLAIKLNGLFVNKAPNALPSSGSTNETVITNKNKTTYDSITSFGLPVTSALTSAAEGIASFLLPRSDSTEFRKKVGDLLGEMIMDSRGGVSLTCSIDSDYNLKLPEHFQPGSVEIFLHENGIRFQQKKLIVLALPMCQIFSIEKVDTSGEKKATVTRIARTGTIGFVALAPVGLSIVGAAAGAIYGAISRQTNKIFLRFDYFNTNAKESFFAETNSSLADPFLERLSEQLQIKSVQ